MNVVAVVVGKGIQTEKWRKRGLTESHLLATAVIRQHHRLRLNLAVVVAVIAVLILVLLLGPLHHDLRETTTREVAVAERNENEEAHVEAVLRRLLLILDRRLLNPRKNLTGSVETVP
jgi:hypothetical protein